MLRPSWFPRAAAPVGALVLALAACGGSSSGTSPFDSAGGTGAGGTSAAGTAGGSGGASAGSGGASAGTGGASTGASTAGGTTGGGASSGGGPKFDVGNDLDLPSGMCGEMGGACSCTAVDILFVIDNSGSMESAQDAIGQAFPQFADAMVEVLPPGTSLHVGVTSTEMGYASSGSTTNCTANSNGQPTSDFYITPDQQDTGKNGAQGRLYVAQGKPYYEISTDATPQELQGLKDWFVAAAAIGTGGSNIEMSSAPAGWVAHPANDATNAGFIRDEGAVMVVFFLQDEPDQTPGEVVTGAELLDMLAAKKAGCGGATCIIGGGMIDQACAGQTPIGDFLAGMGAPAVTQNFPFLADPTPQDFVTLLKDTLAGVIAQKCDEIPPPG